MNIVLGVTGGIAAYKTPELVRRLRDAGADVRVIVTANAARFVAPLALATVSTHGVIADPWGDPEKGGVDHIELARWAELLLIVPATANIIAKLAVGIADDALSTYAVAHPAPLMIAPAMNSAMLQHPTVVQNLQTLRARGVEIIDPESGPLAEGGEGPGRLAEIPLIVDRVQQAIRPKDLAGRSILVTAGPTREAIDPVRFLSNRSSGKMGYAIAEAARRRGADVTLVSGPTSLAAPAGVSLSRVTTASQMHDAVMHNLPGKQIVIKAAAVADYTPAAAAAQKIKKEQGSELTLTFQKTPDILESIAKVAPKPFIVAFAAETESLEANAREKLLRKNADLVVANDVTDPSIAFDSDQNEVLVIARDGKSTKIAKAPKLAIAHRILDIMLEHLPRD
ncbi:MAG TPA: bifunctional phosphopantothenoylcysteine decarboxylase/phosphopantothenate--cysteine ligase CoaBC [Thermoanaerobaculia bacterium]|nr:bifunctional phosphopantothenoylcysteine decarboxylase/phosphopantothenate--cysteine ligase CoaBC [Thermoanaerobaculia bacterium]